MLYEVIVVADTYFGFWLIDIARLSFELKAIWKGAWYFSPVFALGYQIAWLRG